MNIFLNGTIEPFLKMHKLFIFHSLPVAIEHEQVKAEYTNGILTLTLPKANEVKAFKVNVTGELPTSS
jgi:hypothetical protein